MRDEIKLSDEEIESAFDDAFQVGLTVNNVTYTRETLKDYIRCHRARWRSCIGVDVDEVTTSAGTFATTWFDRVQTHAGKPRRDVYVIDFGTVRAVCSL